MKSYWVAPPAGRPGSYSIIGATLSVFFVVAACVALGEWSQIQDNRPRLGVWVPIEATVTQADCRRRGFVAFRYAWAGQMYEAAGSPDGTGIPCERLIEGELIRISVDPLQPSATMVGTPEARVNGARTNMIVNPVVVLVLGGIVGIIEVTIHRWRMSCWKRKHLPPDNSGGRP
jgi:hypothetical protein